MEFAPSEKTQQIQTQLERFMAEHVYPNERNVYEQVEKSGDPHFDPPLWRELAQKAKAIGLWNLFLPDAEYGAGLTNLEYAPLCEVMGRSPIAPRIFNCHAPDTGNMEILAQFGSPEQKTRWLKPLLEGEIRSCFSMTEPEVSSADPTQLQTRAVRDGDSYVINGHKWFTSGAIGAKVAIVMVVTDPKAAPHQRASMILVPTDTKGFNILRAVSVMGHAGGGGHCEIRYEDCRVPASNLLGPGGRRLHDRPGATRPRAHPSLHADARHGGACLRDHVSSREHRGSSRGLRSARSSSCRSGSPLRAWSSTRLAC